MPKCHFREVSDSKFLIRTQRLLLMCVERRRGFNGRPSRRKSDFLAWLELQDFWSRLTTTLRHLLEDRAWDSSHASSSNHRITSYSRDRAASVGKTLHVAVLVVLGPCPPHGLRCLVNEAEVDPRHVREPQHRAAARDFCGTADRCVSLPFLLKPCCLEPPQISNG